MGRYLVLANGFDIAHDLPTLYKDFLFICSKVFEMDFQDNYEPLKKSKMEELYVLFKDTYNSCFKDILNNCWISFFLSNYINIDGTWIDFEKEIKSACIYCSKESAEDESYKDKYYIFKKDDNQYAWDIERMKKDLSSLIEIFNKYLLILDYKNIKIFYPEIINFMPTGIINFNYTNTFRYIYGIVPTDYVHGKIENNNNSIVLGFDSMGNDSEDIEYGEFIKYFQMIEKDIELNLYIQLQKDNKTKETYKNSSIENQAMFFGHSLDKTDGDIIKTIIESVDDVYIVYYDKKHKNQMIKNLIDIFGREQFISLTMSDKKKIKFLQQTEKKEIDVEIEIIQQFIYDIKSIDFKKEKCEALLRKIVSNPYFKVSGNAFRILNEKLRELNAASEAEKKEKLYKILRKA